MEGREHGCVGGERGGWTPLGALRIHVDFERGFPEYIYTKRNAISRLTMPLLGVVHSCRRYGSE